MFIDTCCSFYGPSTNPTFEDDRSKDEKPMTDDGTAKTETAVIDGQKSEDSRKGVDDKPITCPGKVREMNLALRKEQEEKERIAQMRAATLIQSRTRTLLEKKKNEEYLRQQSATCIQRHARGMISRKSSAELIIGRIAGLTRLLAIIEKKNNTVEANEETALIETPIDQERDEKIEDADVDEEKESDRESIEKTEKTKKSSIVFKKVFSFTKKRSNNSQNSSETNKQGAKIPPKSPKNMLPRHLRRKA